MNNVQTYIGEHVVCSSHENLKFCIM